MNRIYIVIEYNQWDAQPQGAFLIEQEAYYAMWRWMEQNPSANWVVKSCTLHK